MRGTMLVVAVALIVAAFASPAHATTYTVTNYNDSGGGSLRQAMIDANATPKADKIHFTNLIGSRTFFALESPLPVVTRAGGALTIEHNKHNGKFDKEVVVIGFPWVTEKLFEVGDNAHLDINNIEVSGSAGGGILNKGTLDVTNSTFSDNSAGEDSTGGGILNKGTLDVNNSTFSGNSASRFGGGIANDGGIVRVRNSTFSGNSANFSGGAIFNDRGTLKVILSTFSGNSALAGGGIYDSVRATTTLKNTIVANSPSGGDCAGNITDEGYNLFGDPKCVTSDTSLSGDPMLGPLANNGGPTETHALLAGSPAIDRGWSFFVFDRDPFGHLLHFDQRGHPFHRIDGGLGPGGLPQGTVDIGAFEVQRSGSEPLPPGTPDDKQACKQDGYEKFGFRTEGECVKAVNRAS